MTLYAVPWVYPSGAVPDAVAPVDLMVDPARAVAWILALLVVCCGGLWLLTKPWSIRGPRHKRGARRRPLHPFPQRA